MNIDTKMLKERAIMSKISSAKDELKTPDEFELEAGMTIILEELQAYTENIRRRLSLTMRLILMT